MAVCDQMVAAVWLGGIVNTGGTSSVEAFFRVSGYKFSEPDMLDIALTHSSLSGDRGRSNERLEFLGDRVLGVIVADELFQRWPKATEGDMARQLNFLVRKESCAHVALELGLGELIQSGPSIADYSDGRHERVLADALEALVAAVYLDGGLQAARDFVLKAWGPLFDNANSVPRDAKTRLQEWALGLGLPTPTYDELGRMGPAHAPSFTVRVSVQGYRISKGRAGSKRKAEQEAAQAFIDREEIEQS